MKIVLDTNIFISGFFWKGDSYKILTLWRDKRFQLITSKEIIDEIIKVLKDFKIRLPDDILKELINSIIKNSIFVKPKEKFDVSIDKSDNKFIEAAIEANADFIITQDNHLLILKKFRNIKIINPKEFLKTIY